MPHEDEEFITTQELESLSKAEFIELEELAKSCPRCGKASANKSNSAGRCRGCLNKLSSKRKTPGTKERSWQHADQAIRREKGSSGTTTGGHKSGHGNRQEIQRKMKAAESKTGQKLSLDRKDNERGYEGKNTRAVPQELNRGRHHVDGKKLKAWKKRLKKCELNYEEFHDMLLAKAAENGQDELLTLLGEMYTPELANFINNQDDQD